MTEIKICGMVCEDDIRYANRYRPDYVGFVLFFPESRRCLPLEEAEKLMERLDPGIRKIAVTVSPDAGQVRQICRAGFDGIQIHGLLKKEAYDAASIPVIRAYNVGNLTRYKEESSLTKRTGLVFDSSRPGSGKVCDWDMIKDLNPLGRKVFLAGGIHRGNVTDAIRAAGPDVIDVSSSVEKEARGAVPRGKDPEKMQEIIRMVHNAE